jgi:hypothetical protein
MNDDDRSCLAQEAFDLSQTHGVHETLDRFNGLSDAELRLLDHETNNEQFNDKWDEELRRLWRERRGGTAAVLDPNLPEHIKAVYRHDLSFSDGYWGFLEFLKGKRETAALEAAGIRIETASADETPERNSDVDDANTIHWAILISYIERRRFKITLRQATHLNDLIKENRQLRGDKTRGIGWFHYTKLRMMLEFIIARKSHNKYATSNYNRFKKLFLKARERSYEYALIGPEQQEVEEAREFGDSPMGHDPQAHTQKLPLKHVSDARRKYVMDKVGHDKQRAAEWLGVHIDML